IAASRTSPSSSLPCHYLSLHSFPTRRSSDLDLLINYRVNLGTSADAARVVFRYSDRGYNVLEILPGLILLKRDTPDGSIFNRARSEETRLNSSHVKISYAVFCLKKKTQNMS